MYNGSHMTFGRCNSFSLNCIFEILDQYSRKMR